jgi:hypothetical protein
LLASGIIDAPVADGLLLGRRLGQQIFVLNHSGRLLWEALRQGCSEADLPAILVDAFGIEVDHARADVAKALAAWREAGLLCAPQSDSILSGLLGGTPVRLSFTDGEVATRFWDVFAACLDQATHGLEARHGFEATVCGATGRLVLTEAGTAPVDAGSLDQAIEQVETALRTAVFRATTWDLALHAASVGLGESAVLLPGQTGCGKSTLAAALLLRGHSHLTDDLALLSSAAEVRPLPLPVVLKAGSWPALPALARQLVHRPAHLRGGQKVRYWLPPSEQIARRSLPVRLIAQPHYRAGARLDVTPMDPLETIATLIAAPLRIGRPLQPDGLAVLARWLEACPAFRLVYGDGEEAARWIENQLAA